MSVGIVPGSFDPITLGHLDIVQRARGLFDEVIVGVATNHTKTPLLSVEERVRLIAGAVADLTNVRVMAVNGLLVDFAHSFGATVLVKGVRSARDLLTEDVQAQVNYELGAVETVFLPSRPGLAFLSSSIVVEMAANGANIASFVPDGVPDAVSEALAARRDAPTRTTG
ncbi:MAG: pantetheine-phosphate adenylyltransferase [Bifidobacteriaceae bacterium]|jgi:pantetheine-phosphate adenylyltransferase|nr:pantetheine-phosphate adenylyltransferase [Bifidobacteriaceae bacterium]